MYGNFKELKVKKKNLVAPLKPKLWGKWNIGFVIPCVTCLNILGYAKIIKGSVLSFCLKQNELVFEMGKINEIFMDYNPL